MDGGRNVGICIHCFISFSDKRLNTLLLVPKAQPEVQAKTTDQQNSQPRKQLFCIAVLIKDFNSGSLLMWFAFSYALLLQLDGFQRHFDSQIILYGKQVILNLVRWCINIDGISCLTFFFVNSQCPLTQKILKLAITRKQQRQTWTRIQSHG